MTTDILSYYNRGDEAARLRHGGGRLELARTQELLRRYLPPAPAAIYDVGGGKIRVGIGVAETEDERALTAVLDKEHPLTTLDDAIEDLVAAVADIDDLTREARYHVDTVKREAPKVGRNDPCPCGSGKKFKVCHGA